MVAYDTHLLNYSGRVSTAITKLECAGVCVAQDLVETKDKSFFGVSLDLCKQTQNQYFRFAPVQNHPVYLRQLVTLFDIYLPNQINRLSFASFIIISQFYSNNADMTLH